jgi:hypothetical protein
LKLKNSHSQIWPLGRWRHMPRRWTREGWDNGHFKWKNARIGI